MKSSLGSTHPQDTKLQPGGIPSFLQQLQTEPQPRGWEEMPTLDSQIMSWLLSPKMKRTGPLNESLPKRGSLLPTEGSGSEPLLSTIQFRQWWREDSLGSEPAWVHTPVQTPGSPDKRLRSAQPNCMKCK